MFFKQTLNIQHIRAIKVGTVMRHRLDAEDITVSELARRLFVSRSVISSLASPNSKGVRIRPAGLKLVCRLLKYLGYSDFEEDYETTDVLLNSYIKQNRIKIPGL